MLLVAFLSWRESCGAALLVGKETAVARYLARGSAKPLSNYRMGVRRRWFLCLETVVFCAFGLR